MKCSNCGEEMSDELAFCEKCGTPLAQAETPVEPTASESAAEDKPPVPEDAVTASVPASSVPVPTASAPVAPTPAAPAIDKLKAADPSTLYSKIGMICGAIMVVAGLAVVFGVNSHVDTTMKFGGDFYTESYQATALAVEAVVTLTKVCGGILAGIGAFTACYFGRK